MRNKIKIIFSTLIVLFLAFNLSAGDKSVSFSGEWVLDEAKSTLDDMGTQFLYSALKNEQKKDSLIVTKTFSSEYGEDFDFTETYSLDGKEFKTEFMNSPRVSTVNWTEDKKGLKIKILITLNWEGQESEITVNETWTIDDATKNLLIDYQSQSQWGDRNLALVFVKKAVDAK